MAAGKAQPSKDTEFEKQLREALRGQGLFGYRLHHRIVLPKWRNRPQHTTPDVAYLTQMVAIYADGDYWHDCPDHPKIIKTNVAEWKKKRAATRARDERHSRYLTIIGWRVFRVWECEDLKEAAKAVKAIIETDAPPGVYGLRKRTP